MNHSELEGNAVGDKPKNRGGGGGGGGNPDWFPADAPDNAMQEHDKQFKKDHPDHKYKLVTGLPSFLGWAVHTTSVARTNRLRLLGNDC